MNALVALGLDEHEFHDRVLMWEGALLGRETPEFATCSITELGFIRVLPRVPQYGFTVHQARALLADLKSARTPKFTFIADNHDLSHLPRWVNTPKQITDGHLVELARANGAVLATLDRKIPGAFLIPAEK